MPCCLITVMAFFPRVALVIMWLGGYTISAFQTVLWPLLGFFFLPYTTCAYAIAMNETGGIRGWTLLLMIVCVILDFGHLGGGGAYSSKRYRG
jgi:hypothetical protein